jgi:hypothetical protein
MITSYGSVWGTYIFADDWVVKSLGTLMPGEE